MLVTASMIAIGDELLSGRTKDANIHYLAEWLTQRGIRLGEVRIIGDIEENIVKSVNELRVKNDYVFTSGGIGPTHDDITFEAIAKAFGLKYQNHDQALAILNDWYAQKGLPVTPERARMAMMPEAAKLIENTASGAPGAIIENVYIMAGVPRIFQAMLAALDPVIKRGAKVYSKAATAYGLPESKLARQLKDIQSALKGVSIGSYPIDGQSPGVTIIARSENETLANSAIISVVAAMQALGFEPEMKDAKRD